MLTRRLAVANPMTCKFFYLLLAAAPLWMPGLQSEASAQVSTNLSLTAPTTQPSVVPPTTIAPATVDTSVAQQGNEFIITGGQTSAGTDPNLVHQFQQFDLSTTDTATFVVTPDVADRRR